MPGLPSPSAFERTAERFARLLEFNPLETPSLRTDPIRWVFPHQVTRCVDQTTVRFDFAPYAQAVVVSRERSVGSTCALYVATGTTELTLLGWA